MAFRFSKDEADAIVEHFGQAFYEKVMSDLDSKKLLLHGDLHHDNILLGENNQYRIIDPKGVIGDPIFDIPRFILNEFYGLDDVPYDIYSSHVETISSYFQKSIGVPMDVIQKCVFVETTMANCWNVENNEEPNMHYVRYAEAMIG